MKSDEFSFRSPQKNESPKSAAPGGTGAPTPSQPPRYRKSRRLATVFLGLILAAGVFLVGAQVTEFFDLGTSKSGQVSKNDATPDGSVRRYLDAILKTENRDGLPMWVGRGVRVALSPGAVAQTDDRYVLVEDSSGELPFLRTERIFIKKARAGTAGAPVRLEADKTVLTFPFPPESVYSKVFYRPDTGPLPLLSVLRWTRSGEPFRAWLERFLKSGMKAYQGGVDPQDQTDFVKFLTDDSRVRALVKRDRDTGQVTEVRVSVETANVARQVDAAWWNFEDGIRKNAGGPLRTGPWEWRSGARIPPHWVAGNVTSGISDLYGLVSWGGLGALVEGYADFWTDRNLLCGLLFLFREDEWKVARKTLLPWFGGNPEEPDPREPLKKDGLTVSIQKSEDRKNSAVGVVRVQVTDERMSELRTLLAGSFVGLDGRVMRDRYVRKVLSEKGKGMVPSPVPKKTVPVPAAGGKATPIFPQVSADAPLTSGGPTPE